MKSIGIDLAGKENNSTGFAVLCDFNVESCVLNSNERIIEACISESPGIVAIDAPLSFSEDGGFRKSDYELINRGYRVLPPDFGGMKFLTERGKNLSHILNKKGFRVIEVHPLTSGKILFDSEIREDWISELSNRGYNLDIELNEHEIDSVVAALTGKLYLEDKTEEIKGEIIIPRNRLNDL